MCWTKMLKSSLSELLASSSPLWPNLNTAVPVISVQFHLVDFGSDSNSQWVSYVVQPVEFSDLVNMTLSVLSMVKKMLKHKSCLPSLFGEHSAALSWDLTLQLCFSISYLSTLFPFPQDLILYRRWGGLYASGTLNQKHDHQGGASSGWSEGKTVPQLLMIGKCLQRIWPNSHSQGR